MATQTKNLEKMGDILLAWTYFFVFDIIIVSLVDDSCLKTNIKTRRSKLGPSIDHLAIVYLLLARPPPDWRSFVW